MAAIDYTNDTVRAAFLKLEARAAAVEGGAALSASLIQLGDSIGIGAYAAGAPPAFNILGYSGSVTTSNYAVNGEKMATELTRVQAGLGDSAYSTTIPSIAIIQSGTNDLFATSGSVTASVLYNTTVKDLIKLLKAKGYYVILMTVLPRKLGAFGGTSGQETERLAYNNLVRANSAGADYVRDLAANASIGDAANVTNDTTYYIDGLHPSTYAQTLMVPDFKAAINSFSGSAVRPSLKSLTLSGGLVIGTASSGTITNATSGSTISSNLSGLTVNSAARTYSWDGTGTAGTTANALSETMPSGAQRSTSLTSTAGAVTTNFIRLDRRGGNVTEAVHSGGGYDYVSGGGAVYGSGNIAGTSAVKIPANQDGFLFATRPGSGTTNGAIFGLTPSANPADYPAASQGTALIFTKSASVNYAVIASGANPAPTNNVPVAANDIIRARRSGTTMFVEVSKDGGTTYTTVYSATVSAAVDLYAFFNGGNTTIDGQLNQLTGSANMV